ncbi:hypothetical protein EUGRSUZ_I00367 [Eucalyptus grandis]|uniref:Uncharacterized protein n=2 Tax=Eucalyptus grandis TaxID=71139 RepID=A0ACC3JDM6_EUCGR|nr:hypothetical protein EUGRSUZ_I00367 [Eucalyptus grandis]
MPTLLCALFVIQTLKFSHSKALTNVSCIGTEREALLKFKQDLTDPSRRLGSWTSEGCCEWEGIQCNKKTGHVSKLNLRNSCDGLESCSLGGKIHPALNELKFLKYLDLSFNDFVTHQTQKTLTSLHKLEYLNLSFAGYGHISNQLSNLSNLRYLDLSGWMESPSSAKNLRWLSTFSNLKYLDLSYASLVNPKEWLSPITMLSSLEFLILIGCDLEDASASLPVNFSSLRFLDLSQNSMSSSIPPWFQNFSKLEHLDLSDNDLQGIFPTIILENNQWLKFLDVSSNRMAGELLKNSSSCYNLQVLSLRSNKFSGGIFNAHNIALNSGQSNLKTVDVSDNNFNGHLPNQFGNFKDLVFLDLSQNSISGPISATLGQLPSLRILNLSFNNLSGKIPKNIGLLANLEVMDIGNNQLDGILTQIHFANLTNLIVLNMYSNKLVINVGTSWVPPFQIQDILMSSCKVGPKFPNWLRTQKKVLVLDMSNASISDEVPHWLSNVLSSIEELDLSGNMLRGNISRIIGKKMPLLTQIIEDNRSGRNTFTSDIPLQLCHLAKLQYLSLNHNNLSGCIPHCFNKFSRMWENSTLYFRSTGGNRLDGQIPEGLTWLARLQNLNLSQNRLVGKIPLDIGNLEYLESLDLSDNKLSDEIPSSISNLHFLSCLDLSNSNLSIQSSIKLVMRVQTSASINSIQFD